jgi:phosphoribosylformylglycinamidine cyclo-ligase
MIAKHPTYRSAGVDTASEEQALHSVLGFLEPTLRLRDGQLGSVVLPNGFFANVLNFGADHGVAISTDGVGSKVLIAQALGKYDTIGIDCVAMNANDVLCVGAEPVALVDYLAVELLDESVIGDIARGLARGAEQANISIPGGEMAQLPETVRGMQSGAGFDLVGTCIGHVQLSRLVIGAHIEPGDVIIGLRSTGIHSNGLTLARKILCSDHGLDLDSTADYLGAPLGEVLLEPTRIYVPEIVEMLRAPLQVKALVHITSDGFLNLARIQKDVGYVIEHLPDPHPIFTMIQELGGVSDAEMFKTYNMGIGFCVVLSPDDMPAARAIASRHGVESIVLGYTTVDSARTVVLEPKDLFGENREFKRARRQRDVPGAPYS